MDSGSWSNGERIVTYAPANWAMFPEDFETTYTFEDAGDCPTDLPAVSELITATCGPDNDVYSEPDQPENVSIQDSGWINNERTLTFSAAEGYVFPENTQRIYTFRDENIACEEDPVTTTLIVTFKTSDDGSLEGAPYSFYAPAASQVAQEPFAEGEIGPGNQIVIADLVARTYRLVVDAEGYERIDELNEVSEEHVITVTALEPVETPTPTPTPTAESTAEATPIPSSTAEPTAEAVPVTALPTTGSGPGSGVGTIVLSGLVMALVIGALANRRRSFP